MSVVNQMLKDLEHNQASNHVNLQTETIVGDENPNSQATKFIYAFCILVVSVVAFLVYLTMFVPEKIDSNIVEKTQEDDKSISDTDISSKFLASNQSNNDSINEVEVEGETVLAKSIELKSYSNSKSIPNELTKVINDIEPSQPKISKLEKEVTPKTSKAISQADSAQVSTASVNKDENKLSRQVVTLKENKALGVNKSLKLKKRPNNVLNSEKTIAENKSRKVSLKTLSKAQQLNERLDLAERAVEQNLHTSAIRQLNLILKDHQSSHRARELLAYSYIQTNNMNELELLLQDAILSYPEHDNYRNLLARQYVQKKQWQKAVDLINATPLIQKSESLLIMQAVAFQRLNAHQSAINVYGELLDKNYSRGDWWIGLAVSLEAVKRFKDAHHALAKASNDPRLSQRQNDYIKQKLNLLKGLF